MNEDPIEVTDDTLTGAVGAAGRIVLASVLSFAAGRSWIQGDTIQLITAITPTLGFAAYAWYRTHVNKKTLIKIADQSPGATVIRK